MTSTESKLFTALAIFSIILIIFTGICTVISINQNKKECAPQIPSQVQQAYTFPAPSDTVTVKSTSVKTKTMSAIDPIVPPEVSASKSLQDARMCLDLKRANGATFGETNDDQYLACIQMQMDTIRTALSPTNYQMTTLRKAMVAGY